MREVLDTVNSFWLQLSTLLQASAPAPAAFNELTVVLMAAIFLGHMTHVPCDNQPASQDGDCMAYYLPVRKLVRQIKMTLDS